MRRNHDNTDRFFEFGIDVSTSTMYLESLYHDGVDSSMAEYAIKGLHVLSAIDRDVTILANNPGGSWYDGMAIYGAISSCPRPVTYKMFGFAMSMGSIIPQAADHRMINKYARFMIHYGTDGGDNSSKEFGRTGDEAKEVNHLMENIYLARILEKYPDGSTGLEDVMEGILERYRRMQPHTGLPTNLKFPPSGPRRVARVREALEKLMAYSVYLSPEETVELGLADEVFE